MNLLTELSVWEYLGLRNEYWSIVMHTVESYLMDKKATMSNAKKAFKRSVRYAYMHALKVAWVDGGGELPVSQEAKDYTRQRIQEELAFSNGLFAGLKEMKKSGVPLDYFSIGKARADGYSRSLDIFYNNIKVINAGKIMLTFDGNDGQESCSDCKWYKGQRHSADWWRKHNAVPPNRDFEDGGWKCMHYLRDDNGKIYTL